MKKIAFMCAVLLTAAVHVFAGDRLDLKSITGGEFSGRHITGVKPLDDGETYARLSSDGKQIVKYSFRTGKQVGTLFDVPKVVAPLFPVSQYCSPPSSHGFQILPLSHHSSSVELGI